MPFPEKLSRILYIDDDADMRMLVKSTLENTGDMHVTICDSAMEMLETAIEHKPQMIVLDVMMPVMNGREVLKEIRNDPRIAHVPVIFLTAQDSPGEVKELLASGVSGLIHKPFDLVKLPDQIRDLWKKTPPISS